MAEQEILTEHELKVMNLIDCIGKLIEVQCSAVKKEYRGKPFSTSASTGWKNLTGQLMLRSTRTDPG